MLQGEEAVSNLKQFFTKISSAFDHLNTVIIYVVGTTFFFMIASVIIGIISRYFLRSPIIWVEEINNYLLLVWAFLPAAWVLSVEGHVVIDTVLQTVSKKKQNIMHTISSLLSLLYFVTLFWISGKWTWESFLESSRFDSMLGPPKFLILMFIPLGSLLLALQCIRRAVHHVSLTKTDRRITEE